MRGDHRYGDEAMVDTAAVAARLGLAPHLVRFLVTHRCIPHELSGERVRFRPAVIDAWAALCGLPHRGLTHPSQSAGSGTDQASGSWDTRKESRDDPGQGGDETAALRDDHDQSRDETAALGDDHDQGRDGPTGGLAKVYRLDDYRRRQKP